MVGTWFLPALVVVLSWSKFCPAVFILCMWPPSCAPSPCLSSHCPHVSERALSAPSYCAVMMTLMMLVMTFVNGACISDAFDNHVHISELPWRRQSPQRATDAVCLSFSGIKTWMIITRLWTRVFWMFMMTFTTQTCFRQVSISFHLQSVNKRIDGGHGIQTEFN